MDKEAVKLEIKKLVEKYEAEKTAGKIAKYSEEETKRGFIEPLFAALGWDFSSKQEITLEEQISGDRVDYGFYLNSRIKFYLEAKPFKAELHREDYAKQSIKYSWNKGVTWAVLSDFESVIVFNALSPEKSLAGKRYFEIPYTEFLERFDQLWLLSREAFLSDSLDKEAEKHGKKIQKISVTEKLAEDLNYCRGELTKAFKTWNKNVPDHLIDEGVQKLLDRLIFIRVAEDRKIEPPTLIPLLHQWKSSGEAGKTSPYQAMIEKFRELDKIYNSNLFSPHPFEKWEEFSGATEKVINKLYGEKDYLEYDFSAITADVLGAVYENYLGYKLEQTKKKSAEEDAALTKSRRKRKEQGIYYTPKFIVDYIVQNALGPVLEKCKSINDLQKIKILDPACGSGSFLVAAMNFLVKKYEEFGAKPDGVLKIQVLQNNIYGVDLDEQAVELARLNLLLNTFDSQTKLPNLGSNIKNGNSLISGTDEELEKYFGKNYRDKKPFNWEEQFPEVFKQGGFDCVIGNPPYVNLANIKEAGERNFLKSNYKTAKNKSDLYSFMTERAIGLLKPKGRLGYIFSNSWLGTDSFSEFRKFLLENTIIESLVKLTPDIFAQATVTTILIFLQKEKAKENYQIPLSQYADGRFSLLGNKLSYERIKSNPGYSFSFDPEISFKVKTVPLGEIARFSLGVKTSNDKKFILDEKKDKDAFPLLRGKDVFRYSYQYANKWLWYKPELMMEKIGAGPRRPEYFSTSKILFRSITGGSMIATLDEEKYFTNDKVHILYEIKGFDLKFILGIANSKLIDKWVHSTFGNLLEIKINQLEQIPIPEIKQTNQTTIVKLVDTILDLNKKILKILENSNEWQKIKDEISQTDKKIDQEVYKFYGLSNEEIKIIENQS
jgi:type I restriction-modification system DNA methylase subunit